MKQEATKEAGKKKCVRKFETEIEIIKIDGSLQNQKHERKIKFNFNIYCSIK